MTRIGWMVPVAMLFLAAVGGHADAPAQGVSVKQTFETYSLIGVFGVDCTKPASKQNLYHVHRAIDDGHVQADQMSGPTDRDFLMMIDQVIDIKPNLITVSGTINTRRYRLTLALDQQRKRTMEMIREPNETVISAGRRTSNGEELPWHSKCS